jgi:quinol monooxygenase YgiN
MQKIQLPKTRTQTGCELIELTQNQNDATHFVILQRWASRQDHANHMQIHEAEGPYIQMIL